MGHHFLKSPVVSTGSVSHFHTSAPKLDAATSSAGTVENPPFEKLMAANRGEIATRIVRAASELGIKTAGIYAHEGKQCSFQIIYIYIYMIFVELGSLALFGVHTTDFFD